VIVDCHVTTGAVSDVTMFIERVNHIQEKHGLKIGEIIADRGYGSAENLEGAGEARHKFQYPSLELESWRNIFRKLKAVLKSTWKQSPWSAPRDIR